MVVIAVGNDGQFRALCGALGAEGMGADPRFLTNALRIEHRAAMTAELSALTAGLTTHGLMAKLEAAGVPCGPVNTVDQVFDEPQAKARQMVVEIPHTATGKPERYIASPIKLSATPVAPVAAGAAVAPRTGVAAWGRGGNSSPGATMMASTARTGTMAPAAARI